MGFRSFVKNRIKQRLGPSETETLAGSAVQTLPTEPDANGFVAVATEADLPSGRGRTVAVGEENIAVFNIDGMIFAIDDACTHEDAPLGEGEIEGRVVVCPYHHWRYELDTGACLTDPDRPVGCFEAKLANGFVWIGARTSSGTQDRGGDHVDGLKTHTDAS